MTGLRVRVIELQSNIREKLVELLPNPSSQDVLEWLFLTMSPVEFHCDAVEPCQWQLGFQICSVLLTSSYSRESEKDNSSVIG